MPSYRFQKKHEEVEVLRFIPSEDFPHKHSYFGEFYGKNIYECTIDKKTYHIAEGDYIIINKEPLYFSGLCKRIDFLRVVDKKTLEEMYDIYDESKEAFVTIEEAFEGIKPSINTDTELFF